MMGILDIIIVGLYILTMYNLIRTHLVLRDMDKTFKRLGNLKKREDSLK